MSALTLGPILFNWKPERRRDFYFRIADEAPVDCVYLGEVVCSKREPFFVDDLPAIAERLRAAGKQVALSTLALVTTDREMEAIRERCGGEMMIEANDVASIKLLAGAPHIAGPFINVFNEATLDFLVRGGAVRVNMPVELSAAAIATLARHNPVETEALVFGRQPLSISMRCYHARAYGLTKDACQFVCELDPDGLAADQLDGKPPADGQRHADHVARLRRAAPRARRFAVGGRDAFPAVAAGDRHGEGRRALSRRPRRPNCAPKRRWPACARSSSRRRSSTATSAAARA